jgi:hypothetical protein
VNTSVKDTMESTFAGWTETVGNAMLEGTPGFIKYSIGATMIL